MKKTTDDGPSKRGFHYMAPIQKCAFKHALRHKFTWDEDPTIVGLSSPRTDLNLLFGAITHRGLEAYYRSRCSSGLDNGIVDLAAAHGAIEAEGDARTAEAEDPIKYTLATEEIHRLLDGYHQRWGPEGEDEFGTGALVVACSADGTPWVERTFEITTAGGTLHTAKTDLVAYIRGHLCAIDHKTANKSAAAQLSSGWLSGQFIGEFIQLREAMLLEDPDFYIGGTAVNVLVKGLSAKTKVPLDQRFARQNFQYDPLLCDAYLSAIDATAHLAGVYDLKYRAAIAKQVESYAALEAAYPRTGLLTGECRAYFRDCEFADLCKNPSRGEAWLKDRFTSLRTLPTTEEPS